MIPPPGDAKELQAHLPWIGSLKNSNCLRVVRKLVQKLRGTLSSPDEQNIIQHNSTMFKTGWGSLPHFRGAQRSGAQPTRVSRPRGDQLTQLVALGWAKNVAVSRKDGKKTSSSVVQTIQCHWSRCKPVEPTHVFTVTVNRKKLYPTVKQLRNPRSPPGCHCFGHLQSKNTAGCVLPPMRTTKKNRRIQSTAWIWSLSLCPESVFQLWNRSVDLKKSFLVEVYSYQLNSTMKSAKPTWVHLRLGTAKKNMSELSQLI